MNGFQVPHHKNASVDVTRFAMIPSAEVPRSAFDVQTKHKTTFNSGILWPIYEDEVLPGDSFKLTSSQFVRLATPIVPVMDNLHLETFYFFVPYRLVWPNFVKMMGEQDNPGDSISYTIPQKVSPAGGYPIKGLEDAFGLPTVGQVGGGNTFSHSALYHRAYALIWNQWFRDENVQNSVTVDKGDGPDTTTNTALLRRGKRKDYFTSALPWPQKGATAVSLPLGTSATVRTNATDLVTGTQFAMNVRKATGVTPNTGNIVTTSAASNGLFESSTAGSAPGAGLYPSNLYADLTTASAATINQIRQAFQTQRLLERDARGGTRYTEIVMSHFRVRSPDARLQRAEYLGGGSMPIVVSPIPQTSSTGLTGATTPMGSLAGVGAGVSQGHGFTQSFTEHGLIIGLASVRADLTYQQGLRRMWSRSTRLDHYMPVFSHLGEQAILNKEIYCDGSANDALVFGYQAAWDDYRYHPSKITGLFRSTSAGTIDIWHLAQKFTALPTLNSTFIQETPPLQRILAVGAGADGQELIGDFFFNVRKVRPMPMHSVPGMVDHF